MRPWWLLVFAACRTPVVATDTSDADTDADADADADADSDGDTGPFVAEVFNIYDVQNGTASEGTEATLTDVVVTGHFGNEMWAQEQAGGPFSGVRIANIQSYADGDVISFQGAVDEQFDTSVYRTTVVDAYVGTDIVTASGRVTTPEPIPQTELTSAAGERWEGVLVKVLNPVVDVDGPSSVQFTLVGGAIVDFDEMPLPEAVPFLAHAEPGATFASITGVVDQITTGYAVRVLRASDVEL